MPRQYEAMRDHFRTQGLSEDAAQSKAAAIYNARHPARPMSGAHPEGAPRRRPHIDRMKTAR